MKIKRDEEQKKLFEESEALVEREKEMKVKFEKEKTRRRNERIER